MSSLYLFMLGLMALPASETTKEYVFNPIGIWITQSEGVAVHIDKCQGGLCGKVVWIADGSSQYDENNPDDFLRGQPLCGLEVISGLEQSGHVNIYKGGSLYRVGNGRKSSVKVIYQSSDTMLVRSSIDFSGVGKSQIWERVSSNDYPPCTPVEAKIISVVEAQPEVEGVMEKVPLVKRKHKIGVKVDAVQASNKPLNFSKIENEDNAPKIKRAGININTKSKLETQTNVNTRVRVKEITKIKSAPSEPRVLTLEVDE